MNFCHQCGGKLEENYKICPQCGAKIEEESNVPDTAEAEEAAQTKDTIEDVGENKTSAVQEENPAIKKIFLLEIILNALSFCFAFIASLLPIVKLGTYSLGNAWQIVFGLFGDIPQDYPKIVFYLAENSILVFPAVFLFSAVFFFGARIIWTLLSKKDEESYVSDPQRTSVGAIVTFSIINVVGAIVGVIVISCFYSIFSLNGILLCILLSMYAIGKTVINVFSFVMLRKYPSKVEKRQKALVKGRYMLPNMILKLGESGMVISVVLIFVVVVSYYGIFSRNSAYVFMGLDDTDISSTTQTLSDTGVPKLDPATAEDTHSNFNQKGAKEALATDTPIVDVYYSCNYNFYNSAIRKIKEEIRDLSIAESLIKYDDLAAAIDVAEEKRDSVKYMRLEKKYIEKTSYYTSYFFVLDASFDTRAWEHSADSKWGKEKAWYCFYEVENITLSRDNFEYDTDFNSEIITAFIQYNDGSERFTIITPENAEELNQASAGIYDLVWSDDWGSYSVQIRIN